MNHHVAALLAMKKRERKCPVCGHKQIVTERHVKDTVACTRCRKPIPPPRASR